MKGAEEIIFVPDKYLGTYVAGKTGRAFILWQGYCPIHARILPEDVERQKEKHPHAEVLVHPECTPALTAIAGKVLSTEGVCRRAANHRTQNLLSRRKWVSCAAWQKKIREEIYPASEQALCPNMKRTTLEKVLWSLQDLKHEVDVPADIMIRARRSIEGMLSCQPQN